MESLSSVYEDVYVVVKRSICYSSLAYAEKEKGLSDLKFREEICLSVCVSLLKRSLCEDESQKDFFEREDEYNEANAGPLKSQERFFLNNTSLFCVSETFGALESISGNAQHHAHHNIFLSFTLKALLILSSRRSDEKRAKSREAQKRETREQSRALRVTLAEKEREREREKVHVGFLLPFFFFSSLIRVLCVVDFFAFFRPN